MAQTKSTTRAKGGAKAAPKIATPAAAAARIARIDGPEGDYARAQAAGDRQRMDALAVERRRLARLADG